MIKRYFKIIKNYFNLKANNKVLLFHLIFSAILRSISLLAIPLVASKIVEYATIKDFKTTIICVLIFLIVSLVYVACHHYNYVAYEKNSIYTHNKLQQLVLDKLTSYDENFTKNISTSHIINTTFTDIGKIMQIPDRTFDTIAELISAIITLIILIKVNIYIGISTLILNIIQLYVIDNQLKKRNLFLEKQRKNQEDIASLIGQILDGNKEIKSFNMKHDLDIYLENYKKDWKKNFFLRRQYTDNVYVLSKTITSFGKILIYLIAIYLILNGQYKISILVLVIGYYENIETEFNKLYDNLNDISTFSIGVNKIQRILNYKTKNMLKFGTNNNDFIKGKIEFKNVSFTYEKQKVMKNMSFKIQPKTFTAIVGKSGSGKSTIFRLLLRLYKTNEGQILLDDENIYNYTKEVYKNNVSIVTQKPFIFDMSIKENLSLIDPSYSNQIEACKKVGVHDYIMGLKNGYNTKLISDAENISSGQKQLLALARVLLSKSEVLLFDEVTSTLDIETSKKIITILENLKKDHTVIMITHKPELMKMADEILVIDHGKLVGKGTHKKLLKENKYYQTLQK